MNRACSSNWVMLWSPLLFPSLRCWIFFSRMIGNTFFTTNATCRLKRNCCKILEILTAHCNTHLQNIPQTLPIGRNAVSFHWRCSLSKICLCNQQLQPAFSPHSTLGPADAYSQEHVYSHCLGNNCFGLLHATASQCRCKVPHVTGKGGLRVILNQLVSMWIISWVNQSFHASAVTWIHGAKWISTPWAIYMSYFLS